MNDLYDVIDATTLLVVIAAEDQHDWFCDKYKQGTMGVPPDEVVADLSLYSTQVNSVFVDMMLAYVVACRTLSQHTLAGMAVCGFGRRS